MWPHAFKLAIGERNSKIKRPSSALLDRRLSEEGKQLQTFVLPPEIAELVTARNKVRDHYQAMLEAKGSTAKLHFTLDGNLVGDIGEALAAEFFGIRLVDTKSAEGIDGYAPDGRTVQVKATGTSRGPAFRRTQTRADHLLFFDLDLEAQNGTVVFNGPEHIAVGKLPDSFVGQRSLTPGQIRAANHDVLDTDRLPMQPTTAS